MIIEQTSVRDVSRHFLEFFNSSDFVLGQTLGLFSSSKLANAFEELQAAKKNRTPSDYVVATGFLYRVVGKRGHKNTAHAPEAADDDVVHRGVARR